MIAVLVVASGWCGTGNQQLRGDDSTADKTKEYEIWRLREIHGKITQLMNQSPASPQERLYGSLSSLHFTQQRQHSSWHPSQLIRQLVNTQLHIEKGEPVRDALELLVAKRPGLLEKQPGTDRVERWRGITVEYEKLAGEPLAWDWTTRRDFWLDYAGWVIESIAYEDPAQFWKEKIDNDAAHADLYRLAYLEVLRADPEKLVQSRLLQPYLDADEIDEHEQILRACLIASLTNPGRSPGDRRLQNRAKNQVLQLVSNDKLNLGPSRKLQPAFRLLYQNIEDRDRTALIRAFLRHQKPAFTWLAFSTADVPEEEIQQWFLARQTNVVVNETPLSSVLTQLSDQVRLPLWFDGAVMNDNRSITLESSGSWLEMLEAVLKETPYKVHLFKAHVIWVGPPEGRKQAEELLRGALSRGAQLPALLEPTECEWIDNAWQDAVDFMSDLHDFQLIKLWQDEAGQGLVTLRQSVVPACLVLALVAEQANLEWEVAEQSV